MGPGDVFLHEVGQEQPGGQRASVRPTDVLHVGHRRVKLGLVVVGQRQPPHPLASALGGIGQLVHPPIVVAHEPGHLGAQRHHARPGEGGQINDGIGLGLTSQRQGVGQHQAALGVGVEHFHCLTVGHGEHIAGPGGIAPQHVVGHGHVAGDLHRGCRRGDGGHHAQHCRSPAHVAFHGHHPGAGLDRQAAGVEGEALAHQRHRPPALGLRVGGIRHLHEPGRLLRPPVHPQQAAQLGLANAVEVEHRYLQPLPVGHLLGYLGKPLGSKRSAGLVYQIAHEAHRLGHPSALLQRLGHRPAPRTDDVHILQLVGLVLRLELAVGVGPQCHPLGQSTQRIRAVDAVGHGVQYRHRDASQPLGRPGQRSRRPADHCGGYLVGWPQPNHRDGPFSSGHDLHLSGFGLKPAAVEHSPIQTVGPLGAVARAHPHRMKLGADWDFPAGSERDHQASSGWFKPLRCYLAPILSPMPGTLANCGFIFGRSPRARPHL